MLNFCISLFRDCRLALFFCVSFASVRFVLRPFIRPFKGPYKGPLKGVIRPFKGPYKALPWGQAREAPRQGPKPPGEALSRRDPGSSREARAREPRAPPLIFLYQGKKPPGVPISPPAPSFFIKGRSPLPYKGVLEEPCAPKSNPREPREPRLF